MTGDTKDKEGGENEVLLFFKSFKEALVKKGMTEEGAEAELRSRMIRGIIDHQRSQGKTDDQIIEIISAPKSITRVKALRLMAEVDRFPDGNYLFSKDSDEKDAYDAVLQVFGLTEDEYAQYLREEVYSTEAQVFEHISRARELENQRSARALPPPKSLFEKVKRYGLSWSVMREAYHIPLCRLGVHDWGTFADGVYCYWCSKKREGK